MRRKLVVANWKMNFTRPESRSCASEIRKLVEGVDGPEIGIAPPYLSLGVVEEELYGSHIQLGVQDVFWLEAGAFTGQVSAPMAIDAGASFAILGHSERRGRFGKSEVPETTLPYFGDTDKTIGLKVGACFANKLKPILCVGETHYEREMGKTDSTIFVQLEGALSGFQHGELSHLVIAYEPVWAIGTGNVCGALEAQRVCKFIRGAVASIYSQDQAQKCRILYGGSVKSSNAQEIFRGEDVDGALVGGASMIPLEFAEIVKAAATV